MDHNNHVGQEVTIDGKTWKIVGTTEDGNFYTLCDVYGREIQMPVLSEWWLSEEGLAQSHDLHGI